MKVLVNTQAQAHSAFLFMLLCLLGFLQKQCFFMLFCVNHSPNPCIMWRSCENPTKHTSTHFCDVAKKVPSEHKYIWNTYTSGSEKACETSAKKVVPTSLDLSLLYTSTIRKSFKILTHGNRKRFWRGQMVNVHHSGLSVVYETRFFQKYENFTKKRKKSNSRDGTHARCQKRPPNWVLRRLISYENLRSPKAK